MWDGKVGSPNRGWDVHDEPYSSLHGRHTRRTGHVPVLPRPRSEVKPCNLHVPTAIPLSYWRTRAALRGVPGDVARPTRPARRPSRESRA